MKCPFSYGFPMNFLWFLLIYQRVLNDFRTGNVNSCSTGGQGSEKTHLCTTGAASTITPAFQAKITLNSDWPSGYLT